MESCNYCEGLGYAIAKPLAAMAERGRGRHNMLCRVSPPLGHTAKNTCSLQGHIWKQKLKLRSKTKEKVFLFLFTKSETQLSIIITRRFTKGNWVAFMIANISELEKGNGEL